jgi:hypothetical protein
VVSTQSTTRYLKGVFFFFFFFLGDNAGLEFRNVQKSILAENQEASPRWTQTPHPESPLVEKSHVCNKTSVAMPKARSTDDPAVGL